MLIMFITCLWDHIVMFVLGIESRRITGYETDDISMFMYCLCIDDYYIAYRWLYFPTCWGFIIIQNVGTPMNHRPFWEQWVGDLVPWSRKKNSRKSQANSNPPWSIQRNPYKIPANLFSHWVIGLVEGNVSPKPCFFPLQYKCFLSTNPLNHPQMFRKTTISALRFLSSGRFGYCAADADCDVRPAVPNSGTWVAVLPVGFAEFRGTLGRKWRWRTTPVGNWFEFYSLLISSYFRSQAEVN